ncbi:Mannosyl-oligosaccharide alpha-1,2-mannosidase IA [Gryllus bimaculatus]|nr:Mannosyl-oligosaccharide alpha-1,2-mannosidase IA [Gryllus bimaculatus]
METYYLRLGIITCVVIFCNFCLGSSIPKYTRKDLEILREEVRQMFQHAYDSYLKYAYPYDELRPLSCDGVDTWGSYSLTLIDALDTLAVMGNYTEFQRVVNIITTHANFDANINVSVFETNIRIIGGLLSAHLLSHKAGVEVDPGWPCNGPLLQLAEDVARRLLAAFDTTTGMPYGTVNLRHGVPEGETSITCTAGVGTFILELGTLSRLTGDPLYEEVAMNALHALYNHRSPIGLVGNHIDVQTGRWTAQDAGIGAGVDSYYEYLVKGAILLQRPELLRMFQEGRVSIDKYLKRDDWHLWVSMSKGQVTLPVFQSLEAYWPGVLSLIGDIDNGMKSLHNYHQVWKQYGFTPEFYNIPQGEVGANRESYPLRPELVESVMYMYRATGDPYLLEVGKDILRSIQHSARTPCGYATIKDVRDHRKEDRMESFFLAETTKYLYLLFDPDNFIHNRGQHGTVIRKPWGECILYAGGYIFNTEAHPIDPGALHCCSGHRQSDIQQMLRDQSSKTFKGDPLSTYRHSRRTPAASSESIPVNGEVGIGDNQSRSDNENEITVEESSAKSLESEKSMPEDENKKTQSSHANIISDSININTLSETSETTDNASQQKDNIIQSESIVDENDSNQAIGSASNLYTGSNSQVIRDENYTPHRTSDLEYRADDSDWVYSVTDRDDRELDIDTAADPVVPVEQKREQSSDSKDESEKLIQDKSSREENKVTKPKSLSSYISELLSTPKTPGKFDHQLLLERLHSETKYKRNVSWEQDYEVLSCSSQPFLQRLAMSGEIFGVV